MKVLLDANALMVPEQLGVDIISELNRLGFYELLVPSPVIEELNRISTLARKGRDKRAARVALGISDLCSLVNSEGKADDVLERLAIDMGAAVFTNDKELKKRLINRGVSVIYLRQGRYLEIARQKEF